MNIKTYGLIALLVTSSLTFAGCNSNVSNEEKSEIANPASVYCEENGGTLKLEDDVGLCMFDDGSYCEEWAYQRGECKPGDIIYNTVENVVEEESTEEPTVNYDVDYGTSELYSQEDLESAVATIMDDFNGWDVACDMLSMQYAGDEAATSELSYCKELDAEVTECVKFFSNFHVLPTDQMLAGAFESDKVMTGYNWYLGRVATGDWKVLTNGY